MGAGISGSPFIYLYIYDEIHAAFYTRIAGFGAMDTLGKRLRYARALRHLNYSELADQIGALPEVIQELESQNEHARSREYLKRIAETLRCELAWLESGEGPGPEPRTTVEIVKREAVSDDDLLPVVILAVEDYFRELETVIDSGFKAQAVNQIYHAERARRDAKPAEPLGFHIADYHEHLEFAKVAFEAGLNMLKRRLEPLGVVFDCNYEPRLRGDDDR